MQARLHVGADQEAGAGPCVDPGVGTTGRRPTLVRPRPVWASPCGQRISTRGAAMSRGLRDGPAPWGHPLEPGASATGGSPIVGQVAAEAPILAVENREGYPEVDGILGNRSTRFVFRPDHRGRLAGNVSAVFGLSRVPVTTCRRSWRCAGPVAASAGLLRQAVGRAWPVAP